MVNNAFCNRIYSTFSAPVDPSHLKTEKLYKNVSTSACLACHQLRQMPCGFAHASPMHHYCVATLILTLLTAATLLASDSTVIPSLTYNFINI